MRRFNRMHLKRNVGGARQHRILRQRGEHRLRCADVGIELANIIGDSVTDERVPGSLMLLRLPG